MIGTILLIIIVLLSLTVVHRVVRRRRRRFPTTSLLGSDRGSIRGYWGAPGLYDALTLDKCSCHPKHKIYRDDKCWDQYDRGAQGLEGHSLPPCY